jgi:hypothetical protein
LISEEVAASGSILERLERVQLRNSLVLCQSILRIDVSLWWNIAIHLVIVNWAIRVELLSILRIQVGVYVVVRAPSSNTVVQA